jgi:serine/threonine-protein kinase
MNTSHWPAGRSVLLSPRSVNGVDPARQVVRTSLSRSEVAGSPDVDRARPVSRQHELELSAEFSDEVEKGVVIDQSPAAGEKVAPHSNVRINVSKGKETVTVPSVIGKNRDDAISTLVNAGLDPRAFPVASSKAVDTVTGQDPPAGKVIEKGSRVRINYSSGPAEIDVPSVIGLQFDQASSALQAQGFAVARRDVDSERPKGEVVDQSPSSQAPKGSTITLSVLPR